MIPHQKDDLMKHHLKQWKASGLTQTAYCHQHHIPTHIFSYYKKKLGYGTVQSDQGDNQLIPINILAEHDHATVHLSHNSGFSLQINPASNLAELKPVLELLRSLS